MKRRSLPCTSVSVSVRESCGFRDIFRLWLSYFPDCGYDIFEQKPMNSPSAYEKIHIHVDCPPFACHATILPAASRAHRRNVRGHDLTMVSAWLLCLSQRPSLGSRKWRKWGNDRESPGQGSRWLADMASVAAKVSGARPAAFVSVSRRL